jgi:hypothetical protein
VSSINLWCVLVGPRVGAFDVTSMLSGSGELEVRSGWKADIDRPVRDPRLCAHCGRSGRSAAFLQSGRLLARWSALTGGTGARVKSRDGTFSVQRGPWERAHARSRRILRKISSRNKSGAVDAILLDAICDDGAEAESRGLHDWGRSRFIVVARPLQPLRSPPIF